MSEILEVGDNVYTKNGDRVGTVRSIDATGIHVIPSDEAILPQVEPGQQLPGAGEMDLMWRCQNCGEMGEIDDMPDACPSCGAGREELYYWTED